MANLFKHKLHGFLQIRIRIRFEYTRLILILGFLGKISDRFIIFNAIV